MGYGRKPEAVLAENEDALSELKAKFQRREITQAEYYRSARTVAEKVRRLKEWLEVPRDSLPPGWT